VYITVIVPLAPQLATRFVKSKSEVTELVGLTLQVSVPQVSRVAMFAVFQAAANVSLSSPLHSIVSSITVHADKSGPVVSSSVSIAGNVVVFPVASVNV